MTPLERNEETMNTLTSYLSTAQVPTRAEIDSHIAQAQHMRADYIAKSIKSGLASLQGLFSYKNAAAKTAVKSSLAHS